MITLSKTAYEERFMAFSFEEKMATAGVIVSLDLITIVPDGLEYESEAISGDKNIVAMITGGTAGVTYTITIRVTDDADQKLEGIGQIEVK